MNQICEFPSRDLYGTQIERRLASDAHHRADLTEKLRARIPCRVGLKKIQMTLATDRTPPQADSLPPLHDGNYPHQRWHWR